MGVIVATIDRVMRVLGDEVREFGIKLLNHVIRAMSKVTSFHTGQNQ